LQTRKNENNTPSISVVVPSYQSCKDIEQCLQSVLHQSIDMDYEIIVVDSSPEDISWRIHQRFSQVRVVHLKQRTLPGRARTIGASLAKGEVILFTDTDCLVDPMWIENLLRFHQKGYLVVGGSVENGTPKNIVGTTEYLLEFNEMNPWVQGGEVKALPSCNLSVHRRVFQDLGYFPDFMKGEDTIFCDRFIRSGGKIYFSPKAKIVHINRKGFIRYLKNQVALGEGALETRRQTRRHGYFLVNYLILVPLIPIYRTLFIGLRLVQSNWKIFMSFLLYYPLIFLGLVAYTWGFIRGPYRDGLTTEKRLNS